MSFLLDTNICSAHMRRPGGLAHRFIQYSGRLWTSSIVLAELYAGAYLIEDPKRILDGKRDLLTDVRVLSFDEQCAHEFGKLRGLLRRSGVEGKPIDLQIAAVALAHDLTVVTHNTRDFERIPGLRVEDWLAP